MCLGVQHFSLIHAKLTKIRGNKQTSRKTESQTTLYRRTQVFWHARRECMCAYVCVRARVWKCMHACMYVCMQKYGFVYKNIYVLVYTHSNRLTL